MTLRKFITHATIIACTLFLASFLIVTPPAGAQQKSEVTFVTNLGSFTIELYPDKAPITVKNFLAYVEAGFFDGSDGEAITNGYASYSRPENSIARNYINSSLVWRLNDRTALLSEMNYDTNDGEIDIYNVSLAVERPPRFSYLLGYRYIEETNSNLLGFDMYYRLTEKYTMAFRELFDLARGETLDFTIAIIRKFPRWFGAVSFQLDEAEDDFGISFSVWPQGLPQAALGSRRVRDARSADRIRLDLSLGEPHRLSAPGGDWIGDRSRGDQRIGARSIRGKQNQGPGHRGPHRSDRANLQDRHLHPLPKSSPGS